MVSWPGRADRTDRIVTAAGSPGWKNGGILKGKRGPEV